jgi:hypothetical protein
MQELFLRLIKGDERVAHQIQKCKEAWNEFIAEFGHLSVDELAEEFSLHQARLEWPFEGNRPFAKEMFPIVGLATLWSEQRDDFDDPALAEKIINAMRRSTMS